MARTRHAQRLLTMMEECGGRLVMTPDVEAKMKAEGMSPYRLATYIWNIKKAFNITITPVKEGRKVVAYLLPTAQVETAAPVAVAVA